MTTWYHYLLRGWTNRNPREKTATGHIEIKKTSDNQLEITTWSPVHGSIQTKHKPEDLVVYFKKVLAKPTGSPNFQNVSFVHEDECCINYNGVKRCTSYQMKFRNEELQAVRVQRYYPDTPYRIDYFLEMGSLYKDPAPGEIPACDWNF